MPCRWLKSMLLEEQVDPMHVLDLCRKAMDIVGKRFEEGEYFLARTGAGRRDAGHVGAIAKPLIKQGARGEGPKSWARC